MGTLIDGLVAMKRVVVLPGDDAAPEAVHACMEVLHALNPPIEWVMVPDGAILEETVTRPEQDEMLRTLTDSCDSVLFGATSGRTVGAGYLRWGKRTYANVRPIRWRQGYSSPLRDPESIDYVIVRENLEDLYLGLEGDLRDLESSGLDLTPFGGRLDVGGMTGFAGMDGRYAIKVITRERTERVARFACELALERRALGHPGKVTCSAKYNVLPRSDGLFREVVAKTASEYDVEYEEFIVDDFCRRLVASPSTLDVVVLPNLYGDILSDEGAATIGGLGAAPSGCYGDDFAYFEPVHGTAPDIVGRGIINPLATMLSAVMMLEYLGLDRDAVHLDDAIASAVMSGSRTPDLGGTATTREFAEAVVRCL